MEIVSPATLEAFAENRIKTLIDAQSSLVPDANILTGHTVEDDGIDQEAPVIIVTVERDSEDIPGTGWWICAAEIEFDPRDLSDTDADTVMNEIDTALGDGGSDIETQLTNGRLKCMTGSVFYDQAFEYSGDAERLRYYRFTASLGLIAP
jgi:hypothetical protein